VLAWQLGLNLCEDKVKLEKLHIPFGQPVPAGAKANLPLHVSARLLRVEQLPEPRNLEPFEIIHLEMTAVDRRRVRRRVIAPDGLELGLALPTGTILEPGTLLFQNDARAYVVAAALEDVLVIRAKNWVEAAQVAHQIGNLHRDVQFSNDSNFELLALWDGALELLCLRLNLDFERDQRPFLGRPSWEH
jgi:urease accessory protein